MGGRINRKLRLMAFIDSSEVRRCRKPLHCSFTARHRLARAAAQPRPAQLGIGPSLVELERPKVATKQLLREAAGGPATKGRADSKRPSETVEPREQTSLGNIHSV